jgi:phosphatidylglycerol:prolipoprotein diacylglycerol transferase
MGVLVFIKVGPVSIHAHLFFETLAYFIGFRVYLYTRNKDRIPFDKVIWVVYWRDRRCSFRV